MTLTYFVLQLIIPGSWILAVINSKIYQARLCGGTKSQLLYLRLRLATRMDGKSLSIGRNLHSYALLYPDDGVVFKSHIHYVFQA